MPHLYWNSSHTYLQRIVWTWIVRVAGKFMMIEGPTEVPPILE
jgi:hypothetical protein